MCFGLTLSSSWHYDLMLCIYIYIWCFVYSISRFYIQWRHLSWVHFLLYGCAHQLISFPMKWTIWLCNKGEWRLPIFRLMSFNRGIKSSYLGWWTLNWAPLEIFVHWMRLLSPVLYHKLRNNWNKTKNRDYDCTL